MAYQFLGGGAFLLILIYYGVSDFATDLASDLSNVFFCYLQYLPSFANSDAGEKTKGKPIAQLCEYHTLFNVPIYFLFIFVLIF